MHYAKILLAWFASVGVCAAVYLAWLASSLLTSSPDERLLRAAVITAASFTALFAMCVLLFYIPIFMVVDGRSHRGLSWGKAAALGAVLALIPRVIIGWRAAESQSPVAWVIYWAHNLPRFPFTILPLVVSGLIFGLLWPTERNSAS